jgi:hypothetical protein
MAIAITDALLRRLCRLSAYAINEKEMLFFGLRGCVPDDPDDQTWGKTQTVNGAPLNYRNPRCVLGQWLPASAEIAIFPGSTVPTAKYVESAVKNDGQGTNQLFTGRYAFEKGTHRADSPNGHRAFRQLGNRIYLRTADDPIYELSDRVETGNPCDNLHAAFGEGLSGTYSSAGCQVVCGTPKCQNFSDSGPWVTFRDNAYELDQKAFNYLLFDSSEADHWDDDSDATGGLMIRCGSHESALPAGQEQAIRKIQTKLKDAGFYQGTVDGDFGAKSALAAINFQRKTLGFALADGIVGGTTALALGLTDWAQVA